MRRFLESRLLLSAARLHGLLGGEGAQTLAEYGLIMAVIAVGVVVPTMFIFRDALEAGYNSAAACLSGAC